MALLATTITSALEEHFRQAAENAVPQNDIFDNTLLHSHRTNLSPEQSYARHMAEAALYLGMSHPIDLEPALDSSKFPLGKCDIVVVETQQVCVQPMQHADFTLNAVTLTPAMLKSFTESVAVDIAVIQQRVTALTEAYDDDAHIDKTVKDLGLKNAMARELDAAKMAMDPSVNTELIPQA